MPSPMLQMALDLLVHGLQHFTNGDPLDHRLAILHLDQAVELTLKERVRIGGRPIMKQGGKESISIYDAYKQLEDLGVLVFERANLDLLHEQRNQIQHLFASPDANTTRFHLDNTLFFLARFLSDEFALRLLDFIPDPLLAHEKLRHIEDMEKLRLLYESAETSYRARKFPEGISSLVAALDLTLQLAAENKQIELNGTSTIELVTDADAKRVLSRRAIIRARKILEISNDANERNFANEEAFLATLNKFRLEANF
jgi:hypothetical protein